MGDLKQGPHLAPLGTSGFLWTGPPDQRLCQCGSSQFRSIEQVVPPVLCCHKLSCLQQAIVHNDSSITPLIKTIYTPLDGRENNVSHTHSYIHLPTHSLTHSPNHSLRITGSLIVESLFKSISLDTNVVNSTENKNNMHLNNLSECTCKVDISETKL